MILVVFSHVEIFGLGLNIDYDGANHLFQLFRMPLFFFVSGFIAYRLNEVWDWTHYRNSMLKKMRVQVIPMLFFGLLFAATVYTNRHGMSPKEAIVLFFYTSDKLGYWFTEVLLEMFVIYYTVSFLMRKFRLLYRQIVLILIAICFHILSLRGIMAYTSFNAGNWFCLHQLLFYFQFFIFGNLVSCYREKVFKAFDNQYVIGIIILLFCGSFIMYRMYIPGTIKILSEAVRYFGVATVVAVFRHYEHFFSKETRIGRGLQYIGQRTLDVYLIHYFLIPSIPALGLFIYSSNSIVLELTINICLSLLIILFCLIISNIIRISPFLSYWLLGVKREK